MMARTRAPTACLIVFALVSLLNRCSSTSAEDPNTSDYIQDNILPDHPLLASKLLSLIAMSSQGRTSYIQPEPDAEGDGGQLELSDVIDAIRPSQKRSLGQCIHNCINGRGNLNFIQCKSMCH